MVNKVNIGPESSRKYNCFTDISGARDLTKSVNQNCFTNNSLVVMFNIFKAFCLFI